MGFHVSRAARDRYDFDDSSFTPSGFVNFTSFHRARLFAQKINETRNLVEFPERAARAGQLNAMALISEILRHILEMYRSSQVSDVLASAAAFLEEQHGATMVDAALLRFVEEFPPLAVQHRELSAREYLDGGPEGDPNRVRVLQEMILLWVANANPAFAPYSELFDDAPLEKGTAYLSLIRDLQAFFATAPTFGPDSLGIMELLRLPARLAPHSITAQLELLRGRWGTWLGSYLYRMLGGLDLIQEEEKVIFPGGPGPAQVVEFAGMEVEPEQFSPDDDWMPRVVLLAKNAYVWLDQLSRKHGRLISRLDEIPDEELDTLARWGITGLWLIGLWERSPASQRIKQLSGNPDAVSSAYSLKSYDISGDLGGAEACHTLRVKAGLRGIRLASDMVPNHMGIDSSWVMNHPDWFLSRDHAPFPTYRFEGPNLSGDDRVGIYLESHYYDRSDAAVVFKRVDHWTGSERYVYHGNDGTSMPWNDTAQLDYLNPEVREAVIQTILHVARQFPIIRFDAAMTLAKRHFQRLWFPQPGTAGAIPSRAECGMSREEFDERFPTEFWRDVVDRVATELPGTLLLAEAFWMMEGYFVRTLGMHRVYNSAFMNMLRDEENAKYRTVIKNTIEFDPEILKRYVNFMNNPDEDTAVDRFGKGDKYFGICTLMVTMPGLPMFGHGQVEGFAEKYGMEYRRAYWDESLDPYLVARHEREVFPLLHRRAIFSGVENFLLFDCYSLDGNVNEDVFAYSNRLGSESALVIYHNRYASTEGWLLRSAAYAVKSGAGDKALVQGDLAQGLGLTADANRFCLFRDVASGLEYIRSSKELCDRGLFVSLGPYQCHVFLDFHEIVDDEWGQYARLHDFLNGAGVPSVREAMQEILLQPIHAPFARLVSAATFRRLMDARPASPGEAVDPLLLADLEEDTSALLDAIAAFSPETDGTVSASALARAIGRELECALYWPAVRPDFPANAPTSYRAAIQFLAAGASDSPERWGTLFGWIFTHRLGAIVDRKGAEEQSRSWLDEWLLGKVIGRSLRDLGVEEGEAARGVATVKILMSAGRWFCGPEPDLSTIAEATNGTQASPAATASVGTLASEGSNGMEITPPLGSPPTAAATAAASGFAPSGSAAGETPAATSDARTSASRTEEVIRTAGTSDRAGSDALSHSSASLAPIAVLERWFADEEVRRFLGVNRHRGVLWFNAESFERLLWWCLAIAAIQITAHSDGEPGEEIARRYGTILELQRAAQASGYQVEKLIAGVGR